MLVQNGADLNAKNKNEETPAGKTFFFLNLMNFYIIFHSTGV